ncbi:23S rRNA (uracil(1939)-C(5))-methyltransferase RlmD [Salisediminibacterium selenitireducens]|uniref:RNA methyltransferase, TrmA family n=1 Tax=Bacillus selenitireducens (strain ATCC 700615 / DSM 15326 / MLS10) TaxID=439292 RepID=D6XYI4_BACIE|nr:23S rRNA (uracil(1939)-C(5))-methyltransferase RlmD [Salisediminibacterium selenitireducens]ADI00253.1 RNA methyltransferase, TrmA family [[Bacillus] selenitireducens MLS10]
MSKHTETTMEPGQRFPLTIKRFGIDGEGIGYFKRQVVFVPGLIPGEEAVVEVTNVRETYAEGKVVNLRKPSEHRVEPPCPVYEACGGCQLQHVSYERQLQAKKELLEQAFSRYTKIPPHKLVIHDTIGMDNPWHYRNKSQMQVGQTEDDTVIAGLYAADSHDLVDIDECIVQHPLTNEVNRELKRIISDLKLSIYDKERKKGLVRSLVVRTAFETDEWQLTLVISKKSFPKQDVFVARVKEAFPSVTSISLNVNPSDTPLVFGEQTKTIEGESSIRERLGELDYQLAPESFFQLNPAQTKVLYDIVKKMAGFKATDRVVDAYCGVGSIGIWAASEAGELRGMDITEAAVANARRNAAEAGIANAHYETGTAEDILMKWQKEGFTADSIIVDPPRSGLDRTLIETVGVLKPKQLIYVSCNPSTLAKNADELGKYGYRIKDVQPVDMFPQTSHVEAVTVMYRED